MKIDISQMSKTAGINLSRSIRKGLDAFYADPDNRRRFEEWQRSRGAGKKEAVS